MSLTFSRNICHGALLALSFLLCSNSPLHAATKIDRTKVYQVTKNGNQYSCYLVRDVPTFVVSRKRKVMLGAEALKALKRQLAGRGMLKRAAGKAQLKRMKQQIKAGNEACRAANDGDGGNPPGQEQPGSGSLAKLARPLTRADIQYLLDKAALGLSSREEYLVDLGLSQGIDALVNRMMARQTEPNGLLDRVNNWLDGQIDRETTQSPSGQRAALLDLWINTNNPYQEKFALFLLSVWTVGGDVIDDETFRHQFWDYYSRLRDFAYGNGTVPDLGVAITRDPLMLVYLNNELNVRGNPNENYARELMELFTLGPTNLDGAPNYSETRLDGTGDIAVAARMLTGWKVHKNYITNNLDASFDSDRHENGPHIMFPGTTAQFSGENDEDLVRGIFAHHPAAKTYYAKEILKLYVTPHPPRELVENFASVIAANNFRLQDSMKVLLKSEAFFDAAYRDTVPMNSLEYAAKTARVLGLFNAVNPGYAEYQMQKMGMAYNMTPSVFWYNPLSWSSSSIALEKANYLAEILDNRGAQQDAEWAPSQILPIGAVSIDDVISFVQNRVGVRTITSSQQNALRSYLSTQLQYDNSYTPFTYDNTNPEHQSSKGLGVYYLMFMSAEFNLL